MNPLLRSRATSAALLAAAALPLLPFPLAAEEKAPFDPSRAEQAGIGMPTPYDKFLALDLELAKVKVNWKSLFARFECDIEPDDYQDLEVAVPAALGVRIADGVMAIKARDAEALNKAASDIEKLAETLGVPDEKMARAKKVRSAANNDKWLEVFMELGFLQLDIMNELADNGPRGDILIIAGWMQGARYTSAIISENYTPSVSNFLREPRLSEALMRMAEKLPAGSKAHPIGKAILSSLPKMHSLIDIPLTGTISEDGVKQIHNLATAVVSAVAAAGGN